MSPEAVPARDRPLRLIVADDEPLARGLVRTYADAAGVEVAAEAATGDDLLECLTTVDADVALVDVRMPGRDVFEAVERAADSGHLPAIVFATAFDTYAVRAFEVNAIDYLIKPYSQERFSAALHRARERRDLAVANLVRTSRDLGPTPDRLLVPDGRRMRPVPLESIVWIKAEGDYARVHTTDRSYLVSRSLKDLEARLDPRVFQRIHRSAIVQTTHIVDVAPRGSSRHAVQLSDGTTLIVSRSRASLLRLWKI